MPVGELQKQIDWGGFVEGAIDGRGFLSKELLHHGRRAGEEEKIEIQVVSGEANLIDHIETYQL